MLNKIKIGPKLIGGFVIMAIIAGVIGFIGIQNLKIVNKKDTFLFEKCTVPMGDLIVIAEKFQQMRVDLRDMIRTNDNATILAKVNRINELNRISDSAMQHYTTTFVDENDKRNYDALKALDEKWAMLCDKLIVLAKENKDAEAYALLDGEGAKASAEEGGQIERMVEGNIEAAKQTSDSNTKTSSVAVTTMLITTLIGIILAIVAGIALTLSLTRPLARAVKMIQELGKGHLGMRLKMNSEDEIGIMAKTMDQFADDLQTVVVGTMKKISEGDVSMNVEKKDNQDEIAPALKNTVDALKGLISETKNFVQESLNGNLSTRGDADGFKGAYKEIIEGLNKTMEAIVVPINESSAVLEKVAARDMSARMKGDYKGDFAKMKNSINSAVDNLDQALTQVSQATEQVSSASQQISAGSQSLAQGANEQASSLEEISSSLEEMTSMTKQSADNANQAKSLAVEANGNAKCGVEAMKKMVEAIQKIKVSSDETSKIIKTIDEIAMQTNLLALNAAVEAARAGEAGRGFAVVAEEVRNLAQRSAEAAKNTANMIAESVKNADDGVKIAGEVSSVFASIDGSAKKVNDLISEIAAASQEQSQGIEQVNTAVAQMDKVTQQNAANAEESASAAEELSSQAEELQGMVGQFTLSQNTQGKGTFTTPSHHAVHQQVQPPVEHKKQKVLAIDERQLKLRGDDN